MENAISFQRFRAEMAASACRLSTQAGWEQTEEDWLRFTRMKSARAWVWMEGEEVRASFSVASYGETAWIGMILVDETLRGRGLGKQAFAAALRMAQSGRTKVVGLDATNLGEPIYAKFGFEVITPVTRWAGTLVPQKSANVALGFHESIATFDRQCGMVDRRELLEDLARSGGRYVWIEKGASCRGYAVLRPSRTAWHLGPVVAHSEKEVALLLDAVAEHAGGRRVICDVLQDSQEFRARGLEPSRFLKRMTAPQAHGCLAGHEIWCGAGFEWA